MAARMIRPARPEDIDGLLRLNRAYCQQAYKGFDVLCEMQDDKALALAFTQFIADPQVRLPLMYLNDQMAAFSVYRLPDADPGEILNLEYTPDASLEDVRVLMGSILKDMTRLGTDIVQVWLLRDNLRARFYYQQFGFKPAGSVRQAVVGDLSLQYTRYIYRLKEDPSECLQPAGRDWDA